MSQVTAALVIAKRADGSDVYLYQGSILPAGLADGEEKRLVEGGYVAPDEPVVDEPADPEGAEPPRSGRGSGVEAWTEYATSLGIEVPEGASRDDVVALVDDSK